VHMDAGNPVVIGADVTIGHRALLHGCSVGDGTLIANGAMLLDRVRVGRNCLIAAGALVPPDAEVRDGCVIMGAPGKVVRQVTDTELAMMRKAVMDYLARARHYRSGLGIDHR
jgi:carbonic anhydrase/acetyltransferase-like protein (isoleucine patch superfamily)